MKSALSVSGLSFIYPEYTSIKNRPLYDNLSFDVEDGEIALFLAPPETGKTTLSRIITSLIPRYTGGDLSGIVSIAGTDVQKEKPYNINDKVGIVFQDPEEQILTPLVESEIAFALESAGNDNDFIEKQVESAIDFMEIENLREKNPALLSGGEKRKLLLTCLAASDPLVWILDETLEEIDPEARKHILEKLKKSGKTVFILTSKMLDIYRNFCDRFFLYTDDKLLKDTGKPGEVFMQKAIDSGVFLKHENIKFPSADNINNSDQDKILLKAENIRYNYPGSTFSLEIGSFELRQGEVVALLGHNGSGKSTFSKILAGLIKPDSGEIYLSGDRNSGNEDQINLNRNIAYIFQNPDYQLFLPTVSDELSFGLKGQKIEKDIIKEKVDAASDIFRLENPDTPPALMSYGARKRLQAAVYYLLEKRIILIDEADSGLSFNDYSSILEKLNSSSTPHSIMIITHDVKLSAKIADRIMIMKEGSIVEKEPEKEFEKLVRLTF